MNSRRDNACIVAMLAIACPILYRHVPATPIRWDFLEAYGADVLFIFRPATVTNHLGEFLLLGLLWFAGWGAGHALYRAVRARDSAAQSILSSWATFVLLGWGLISHGLVLLAAIQLLNSRWISVLLSGACLLGLWELRILQPTGSTLRERLAGLASRLPKSYEGLAVLVVCVLLLAGSFFSALMPPTQSDALRYHLTTPRKWLEHGGFCRIPNISFSNFPMTIDIVYAIPLAFGLPSGAKLIHWSFLVMCLGLLQRMGWAYAGRAAGRLAAVLFVTVPFVPILASWAFIEMGLCAYLLLTVAAALELARVADRQAEEAGRPGAIDDRNPCAAAAEKSSAHSSVSVRNAVLLGLAGGWLLGCKYTSVIYLSLLFLLLLMPGRILGAGFHHRAHSLFLAGSLSILVAGPWYIKNFLYNGNPVYPMGISLFGEREWTTANAAFFSYHAGMKGDLNAARYLSLPGKVIDTLTLLVRPLWSPMGANKFGEWPVSALFIILLPSLLFGTGRPWPGRLLSAYGGLLFIVWAWTYRDARFLLAPLAILALPISISCARLWSTRRSLRVPVLIMVVFYGLWNAGKMCDRNAFSPWPVVSGMMDEDYYLRSINQTTRSFYHGFEAVDRLVPPDALILIHGQHYNFHCPRRFIGADWFDTPPLIMYARQTSSPADLASLLAEIGISFVLYDMAEIERYNTVVLPAYWLMCLPVDKAVDFIGQLRDLEPSRRRYRIQEWAKKGQVRRTYRLIRQAIESDPGWQRLSQFLESSYLETVYNQDGIRLAKLRPPASP